MTPADACSAYTHASVQGIEECLKPYLRNSEWFICNYFIGINLGIRAVWLSVERRRPLARGQGSEGRNEGDGVRGKGIPKDAS